MERANIDRQVAALEQEIAGTEAQRQIVIPAPQAGTVTAIQTELGSNVDTVGAADEHRSGGRSSKRSFLGPAAPSASFGPASGCCCVIRLSPIRSSASTKALSLTFPVPR